MPLRTTQINSECREKALNKSRHDILLSNDGIIEEKEMSTSTQSVHIDAPAKCKTLNIHKTP